MNTKSRRDDDSLKSVRQEIILELVKDRHITAQKQLENELKALGVNCTQATLSRDINELRLVKKKNADGIRCYVPDDSPAVAYADIVSALVQIESQLTNLCGGVKRLRNVLETFEDQKL